MSTNILRIAAPFLLASTLAAALFVGCSDDSSSNNNTDPTLGSDSGTRDTGTGPADTGTPSDTGTPGDSGPSDAPWSLDSGKCFNGTPTKMVEFLNRCTTADKVKFDKTKLTKLNPDGTRPPLP